MHKITHAEDKLKYIQNTGTKKKSLFTPQSVGLGIKFVHM